VGNPNQKKPKIDTEEEEKSKDEQQTKPGFASPGRKGGRPFADRPNWA
jgi:hypothetical protein